MPDSAPSLVGAVDLGGTKILSVVVDADGQVRGRDLRPTEGERGPSHVLARMRDSLRAALAAAGVAVPGPIDVERGVVVEAPNLRGWRDVPVAAELGGLLGAPVVIEND